MQDTYRLQRFVEAQDHSGGYDQALREIRAGRKDSHWIWWVFPQIVGLGRSLTSREYSISSIDEARAYLLHPVLGPRLREAAAAINGHHAMGISSILGWDDVKFRSSMTLFMRADPGEALFRDAIDIFFDGVPDATTDEILGNDQRLAGGPQGPR
jgi:uncharacterized protein (DUF1810 family)